MQVSPGRVATAVNESRPELLPVTMRASNEPLGPRVTFVRRLATTPLRLITTCQVRPFRF